MLEEKLIEIKGKLEGLLSNWPSTKTYKSGTPPGYYDSGWYRSSDAPRVKKALEEIIEEISGLQDN